MFLSRFKIHNSIGLTNNIIADSTIQSGSNTASNVKSSVHKGQLRMVINKNKNQIVSDRGIKGSKDVVQQYNKYGCLAEDEYGSLSDEDDGKVS